MDGRRFDWAEGSYILPGGWWGSTAEGGPREVAED